MEEFINFLINNGLQLLYLILTTLVSYLTIKIKSVYNKYVDNEVKKSVAEICVRACEQLYNGNDSNEKYEIAKQNIKTLLESKNIKMTDLEIQMMIESFCNTLGKEENDVTQEN